MSQADPSPARSRRQTGNESVEPPRAATLGELRASGWRPRTVKAELRTNLLARLGEGAAVFPGVVGYADSVLPAVENAILAGHDLVFLGERGQGKTR
ncbi:MAG: magnesium chelatase, partial [Candidatus Limnocylindrales bacterium]